MKFKLDKKKWRCAYGEEFGRIGKPGLDEGGGMEDDLAAREDIQERVVVGNITVGELKGPARGRGREARGVAGASDQSADKVALFQEGVAQSPS